MTQPIYAIGDTHGQIEMVQDALDWIEADGGADAKIVFLGDYVDRGPDSKAVIEILKSGIEAGRNWTALKGNHDRMFEWFMEDTPRLDPLLKAKYTWVSPPLGGDTTLASYGLEDPGNMPLKVAHPAALEAVPADHVAFLKSLKPYYQTGPYLFVHAGIRPGVALEDQTEDDCTWIREPFLSHADPHPWLVVHGHTALEAPQDYGNRLNLDSGAGFGRPLTIAVLEGESVSWLAKDGRIKVR